MVFRVDDKLRVQICDNALSRDLFPADYHCLGDNENRPIKWLSIESLTHKTFSTASDVVSILQVKYSCSGWSVKSIVKKKTKIYCSYYYSGLLESFCGN